MGFSGKPCGLRGGGGAASRGKGLAAGGEEAAGGCLAAFGPVSHMRLAGAGGDPGAMGTVAPKDLGVVIGKSDAF